MAVAWGELRSKKWGKDGSNPLEGLKDHLGAPTDGTDLTDWLDPARTEGDTPVLRLVRQEKGKG